LKSIRKQLLFSSLLLMMTFLLALSVGRIVLPLHTVLQFLGHLLHVSAAPSALATNVLFNLRLPRIIAAMLIGAGLAISGTAFQALFHNPLVSPDLLGVSNGAAVGAAGAILLGATSLKIQGFALLGGLLAVLGAVLIQRLLHTKATLTLVLAGIIMSGFMQAVLGLFKYMADPDEQLPTITYWQLGSLEKVTWASLVPVLPALIISGVLLIAFRWRLNVLLLDDTEIRTLGSHYQLDRALIILLATILTACSVCLSGTIGWIGLVIPHAARLLIGQNEARVLPLAAILGAIFLLLIDTLARSLSTGEIPLSILTGFIGTPLFVWLIFKKRVNLV
jgi:iron complex transport system permease protein